MQDNRKECRYFKQGASGEEKMKWLDLAYHKNSYILASIQSLSESLIDRIIVGPHSTMKKYN